MKEAGNERKEKSNRKEQSRVARSQQGKKPKVRLIPVWLRLLLIVILLLLSLVIGAMVGYGVIGEGNALDVLKKETWQHIIDIVVKEQE